MRKIFLFFVLLLGLSSVMISCDTKPGGKDNSESKPIEEETKLSLVEDGSPKFNIICSYEATRSTQIAATRLKNELNARFGCSLSVGDDYNDEDRANQNPIATDDLEILVGKVNRVEYETAANQLKSQFDWGVAVVNNKVLLLAKNEDNLTRAVEYLIGQIENNSKSWTISDRFQYFYLAAESPLIQSLATQYMVIYAKGSSDRTMQTAHKVASMIEGLYEGEDDWVETGDDTRAVRDYEILFGETNREESQNEEPLGYHDYDILLKGNKILVRAGNSLTMEYAGNLLMEMIAYSELKDVRYRFDESFINPYALNPDSFVPVWKEERVVPEWMTDFNEKLYAITNPEGRLMTVSHRADMVNYPENSLEGILSAIELGADVLELDIRLTKDNVLIMFHDDTLERTTNVSALKGKNGLPNSVYPSDWTYEELRSLSLRMRDGTVTSYKIPTFYEVLMVARDHCFIAIDQKVSSYRTPDILEIETELDALEVSAYAMFLTASTGGGPAQSNSWSYMVNYSKLHPELTKFASNMQKLESYMKLEGHAIRSRGWVNGSASANPDMESEADYKKTFEEDKITLMYCNNIPKMSSYIAKNFTPDLS